MRIAPLQMPARLATRSTAALIVAAALGLPPLPARTADMPAPEGEVLLAVGGDIARTNAGAELHLDLALLDSLPQHEFATATIWTEGVIVFRGVLLRDLLAAAGARGTALRLTALNDYEITMPVADVAEDGPLLAYRLNGKPMTVREKGPVWVVYPYDANPQYRTEQAYSRSVWQLERIEVAD